MQSVCSSQSVDISGV